MSWDSPSSSAVRWMSGPPGQRRDETGSYARPGRAGARGCARHVRRAYGVERLEFGRQYIIPKPFDSRVLIWEAAAVAQAAMETGVAQAPIDINEYREQLERRLGKSHEVMRVMIHKAQRQPKRVVFPEGEEPKILRACQILIDEKIAHPILLGDEEKIRAAMEELHLHGRRADRRSRKIRAPARPMPRRCTACASAKASRGAKPSN